MGPQRLGKRRFLMAAHVRIWHNAELPRRASDVRSTAQTGRADGGHRGVWRAWRADDMGAALRKGGGSLRNQSTSERVIARAARRAASLPRPAGRRRLTKPVPMRRDEGWGEASVIGVGSRSAGALWRDFVIATGGPLVAQLGDPN